MPTARWRCSASASATRVRGPDGRATTVVDLRVVGKFLYFLQPRVGEIGRYTIGKDGLLGSLASFGGLDAGVEPFAGFNPGISAFTDACYLQDPVVAPECGQGSSQGLAAY